MIDLKTTYMGLELCNPIIISSSGLTDKAEKIAELEKKGAGAVVLKSLFEEQIANQIENELGKDQSIDYPEASDYIAEYTRNNAIGDYLKLIADAKSMSSIPIIASINCFSNNEWMSFAKKIQEAGADGLELNVHIVNTDKNADASKLEEIYYNILRTVKSEIDIPVSIKLGDNFINLVSVVDKLRMHGADAVVLFNRFYRPDIDINKKSFVSSPIFSNPGDMQNSLRWVAIVSGKISNIDISASNGNHSYSDVIKQLLAGASAVQLCSTVYENGASVINEILDGIKNWMNENNYSRINDFRGVMNYKNIPDSGLYERAQFMKYFSSHK